MTPGLLFMLDWLVTSGRKGLDLLVIGSIEDIAAPVFGIYKVTPGSGHGV